MGKKARPAFFEALKSPSPFDPSLRYPVQSTNFPLPSTVAEIIGSHPQKFRILVIGKAGCGKSSLVKNIFSVDVTQIHHSSLGKSDIDTALSLSNNGNLVVHVCEEVNSGKDSKLREFIEQRSKVSLPEEERLHAIWVCISTPDSNDSILDGEVEDVLRMCSSGGVPAIMVFTKYDILVSAQVRSSTSILDGSQLVKGCEDMATSAFEELCIRPLRRISETIPIEKVSVRSEYKPTISQLIKTTEEHLLRGHRGRASSRVDPVSLSWAVAQRGSADVNITTSVEVGRKKYWRGLLSSTDFAGRKMQQCIDVIHVDIVAVWNLHDSQNCLGGDEFKAVMSNLVRDLAGPPTASPGAASPQVTSSNSTASSIFGRVAASMGSGTPFAKWVTDIYNNTLANARCVMGYIVDLTITMNRLFLHTSDVSKEHITFVHRAYMESGDHARVHSAIRQFTEPTKSQHLVDDDSILEEIIRLIKEYCADYEVQLAERIPTRSTKGNEIIIQHSGGLPKLVSNRLKLEGTTSQTHEVSGGPNVFSHVSSEHTKRNARAGKGIFCCGI